MGNKKVLSKATRELNKTKRFATPKNIIEDPRGQWAHPGEITRIPSDRITMQGVPYPVMAYPNMGEPQMMYPGGEYYFPGADYVDEYPELKKGGTPKSLVKMPKPSKKGLASKKFSRSLEATNRLFTENPLFAKPKSKKRKVFDPNAQYQMGGDPGDKFKKRLMKRYPGMQDVYGAEGENLNIVRDPNYNARSAGYGDIEFTFPGDDPVINYPNLVEKGGPDYNYPNPSPDKYTALYNPRGANRGDVFLDMMHGMRDDPNYLPLLQNFEEAVKDARGEDMTWQYEGEVEDGSTQTRDRFDENYVDSQLRAELAPGSIGMFSKGRKDYRIERKYDSPEMRAAAKDIRNYLKGKPAEEDYVEAELTPEEIQEYARGGFIIEDISVPTLNQKQEGGEPKRKKTRFQKGTYDPNETAGYILDEQEVVVPAKASNWGKAAIAYEKRNPEEEFINKKKKQYLKKNKGLNELYGINMENFPEDVEQNFRNEYDYNKNTAVVKKVGKQEGWNPNRRTEYVDNLNDTQRGIVAESKYGSKLQPGYWNRSLAGVQELGNTLLPGQPFQFNIPGLTKKEQKEMRDSKLSALETLAPIDIPGAAIANFVKNRGLSTGSDYKKLPGLLSGEKMANVTDVEAMALNPFTYAGLEAIPELGVNIVKGAKALPGAISASKESGLLSNAYKANPFANKLNKYNRVVGEDAVLDLQNSGLVRAGDYGGVESNFGSFDGIRTTPYPSFGTGAPRQAYIDQTIQQGKSPFIISTDRTMKASNLGRHGKGSTMFPIDETGKYMSAFSADDVKVFDVKPHWLKGYKEVPKELPGSPNQTAGFAKSITGNEAVQARSPFQQVIDQISTTVSEVPKNIKYKINNYQNIKKAPDLVKDEIAKMLTPEGKARLKDLGVDDTDDFIKFMDRSKLFTKRGLTSHAGMTVGDNNVMSPFMNLDFEQLENLYDLSKLKHKDDLVRAVISHEIGHNIQGYLSSIGKATNRGVSNLDKETILKLKPFIDKNADAKTVKYFFEGSDKSEPLAHLRELKQNMLFKGVIDNIHQNITAEDLGNFYINKGGYSDRIMHSIKPGEEAYKKLARLLNKTPVLAPVAIGAGATLLPQEKSGGIVMELSDAEIKVYKKGGWIIEEM